MIRVQNDTFGRAIHNLLYERMLTFAQQYTPELLAEPIITAWLNRLYRDDQTLHILVNVDAQYSIIEHAVIEVTGAPPNIIVVCHQTQRNKPNLSTFTEGIEYIDKLVQQTNAMCSIIFIEKHVKAYEKYGYKTSRIVMFKTPHILDNGEEIEE